MKQKKTNKNKQSQQRIQIEAVHLLLGDLGRIRNCLDEISSTFLPEGPDATNFFRFDAEEADELPFVEAENISFFSPKKLIFVGGLERASSNFLEALLRYLDNPNVQTCLVIYGDKIHTPKKGSRVASQIRNRVLEIGAVIDFNKVPSTPLSFIRNKAKEVGKSFKGTSAKRLLELSGESPAILDFELDKLFSFVGVRQEISEDDVEAVCSRVADVRIWDLTDALLEKNSNQALVTIHRLQEEGKSAHPLFGLIAAQLRTILRVQSAKARNEPPPKLHALKRQKIERLLKKHRLEPFDTFSLLRRCNLAFNSSKVKEQRHLEDLIIRLCM